MNSSIPNSFSSFGVVPTIALAKLALRQLALPRPSKHHHHQLLSKQEAGRTDKEKARVLSVDHFVPAVLHKVALVFRARKALADDLGLQREPLLDAHPLVVARQAGLALLVHHQHELDHRARRSARAPRVPADGDLSEDRGTQPRKWGTR